MNHITSGLIENLTNLNISETLSKIWNEMIELKHIAKRASTPISPLDTWVRIARYEYPFLINGQFDYENDTYNVLISTYVQKLNICLI